MEAQYRKFLDMIRAVRINVPLVDVLAGMPNYGKFLKELVSNKHKLEQISSAFLNDESSAIIQNKVSPKLGDLEIFLIPCNFSKAFSCNALADLGASINLMPYSLYAKLSLETLKPTKMSVRLANRSFQHPIGIAENMLVKVGKFTFPVDFVILEMKEDSKVSSNLRETFHPYCRCSTDIANITRKGAKTGQKQTRERKEYTREGSLLAKDAKDQAPRWQARTSSKANDWLILTRDDTRTSKETHQQWEYCTKINVKEAHSSKELGLPRWQSVCSHFNLTAKIRDQMIEERKGQDQKERPRPRNFSCLINRGAHSLTDDI
ncbi:reverse transcriptase domain-containing protein [Tanacetum coccineum]